MAILVKEKIANVLASENDYFKEEKAMKPIRLEFPLCWGENPEVYMPSHVYLKVIGTQTEAFSNREFTEPLPKTEKKISLEMEVPEELEEIEVVPPGGATPVQGIGVDWLWYGVDPKWKIPGLQKVLIILDGKTHEVSVSNERPDFQEWKAFTSIEGEGRWWFMMPWALAVYVTDTKTFGGLFWHSKLARGLGSNK